MAEPKTDALVKSVESLVQEKEAIATREKDLVDALNTALRQMGYHVVPIGTGGARRRGRPPGGVSANGRRRKRKKGPGRPAKNGRRKKRGRPPKAEKG